MPKTPSTTENTEAAETLRRLAQALDLDQIHPIGITLHGTRQAQIDVDYYDGRIGDVVGDAAKHCDYVALRTSLPDFETSYEACDVLFATVGRCVICVDSVTYSDGDCTSLHTFTACAYSDSQAAQDAALGQAKTFCTGLLSEALDIVKYAAARLRDPSGAPAGMAIIGHVEMLKAEQHHA